jgi:hypothetical protein
MQNNIYGMLRPKRKLFPILGIIKNCPIVMGS